jgi:formate hydrogenlyase transcriptional activator
MSSSRPVSNSSAPGESGARLFCISDFRHKHTDLVRQYNRGTGERKQELKQASQERLTFPREIDSSWMYEEIVSSSEAFQQALAYVPNVAPTDCTVLITGERGTGKELVARAIHKLSHRSPRAFVRVNCATIPPPLIASELFGQQESSLSLGTQPRPGCFQLAEGGTIFLDGIGELSPEAQHALLQVLQEMKSGSGGADHSLRANVRLIAATNRDLGAATADGSFRKDLFYRLNTFSIELPSLRESKEDIPALVQRFLNHYARAAGKKRSSLSRQAMALLQSYPWPGNIRELQCVMERFVSLWEAKVLSVEAKWIPWESISARTSVRSISEALAPNESELLEAALMEMLAVLPGWEPGVCWDLWMEKSQEGIAQENLPCDWAWDSNGTTNSL